MQSDISGVFIHIFDEELVKFHRALADTDRHGQSTAC